MMLQSGAENSGETAMSEYDNITITAEETCQILHISKRKCAWMLQNGMIPCLDSGKKTRRYTILLKDVLDFKDDYEAHPNKYFIPVTFSTSKTSNPRRRNPYYLTQDKVPLDFRDWLVDEWFDLNDIVTPKEVGEILGYDSDSIRRWLNRKWLKSIFAHGKEIIAIEWLIDFMCAHGFEITKKSQIHTDLLDNYFTQTKVK